MKSSDAGARRTLLVLLFASLILVIAVFRPLAEALFLAAVLAMVLWPAHRWLTRKLRGRRGIASGILVGGVVILIVGPLIALSTFVIKETIDTARFVATTVESEGARGLIKRLPDPIENQVNGIMRKLDVQPEEVQASVEDQAGKASGPAAGVVRRAVTTTGSLLYQGVMMILALFFFLTNKEGIIRFIDDASPLRAGQTTELLDEFVRVCKSVIMSTAVTALVQAVAALIGYTIAGVPFPFFFFALTFVIAFIPAVGAASVCLLAAAIQLATGHQWSALFLAIYAFLVVGLVDNVVKPLLMRHGANMHGAIIFFALLGGLAAFGAMGLLIGPLAVALFLAMLRIYQRDYASDPKDREAMRRQGVGSTRPVESPAAEDRRDEDAPPRGEPVPA